MFELEQAMSITGGTPPTLKLALFSLIGALLLAQVIAVAYVGIEVRARPSIRAIGRLAAFPRMSQRAMSITPRSASVRLYSWRFCRRRRS